MSFYDFSAKNINGQEVNMSQYKGKVVVVVNTASKCGFTPQYGDLENIYEKYNSQGLEILGFPCNQFSEQEPGSNSDVTKFCEINYGVTFQLFEKTDVRGISAHPIFKYLSKAAPFNGFNLNELNGNFLNSMLKEKFPEYLIGDSIKWNFTKFIIDREGNVVDRFEPTIDPLDMIPKIEELLLSGL